MHLYIKEDRSIRMTENNGNSQYAIVKEFLKEEIKKLPLNTKIMSRPKLALKYNTSRTTIDRAISELIGEGLLTARDGSGTYVIALNTNFVADKQHNWGVILPDIRHDTYPGILRGIEDEASKHNINTIICNSDNDDKKQSEYLNKLIKTQVSGVIIVPALFSKEESIKSFKLAQEAKIPIVLCNRDVPFLSIPKVISNNFFGGYTATRHLLEMGYRRVAFITKYWYSTSMERLQGYLSALEEKKICPEESLYTFPSDDTGVVDVRAEMHKLLEGENPPDAVFCFNDAIAELVFPEILKSGRVPGKNFGLVGYDDTSICEKLSVKLTSVRFRNYEIGHEAALLMLRITAGEHISNQKAVILQPELIIRESSKKS